MYFPFFKFFWTKKNTQYAVFSNKVVPLRSDNSQNHIYKSLNYSKSYGLRNW